MNKPLVCAAIAFGAAPAFGWAQVPRGPEFQVNVVTTGYQDVPSIAADANGNFVIVWHDQDHDGDSYGVVGRRFDAAGGALGAEFRVNSYTTDAQALASVASDPSGRFVITWVSHRQDGNGSLRWPRTPTATSSSPGTASGRTAATPGSSRDDSTAAARPWARNSR